MSNIMDYSKQTKQVERLRSKFDTDMSSLIQKAAIDAAKAFKTQHPKRQIGLKSGMGTAFYIIDSEVLDIEPLTVRWKGNNHPKFKVIFKPLIDFFEWYDSILEKESLSDYLVDFDL